MFVLQCWYLVGSGCFDMHIMQCRYMVIRSRGLYCISVHRVLSKLLLVDNGRLGVFELYCLQCRTLCCCRVSISKCLHLGDLQCRDVAFYELLCQLQCRSVVICRWCYGIVAVRHV